MGLLDQMLGGVLGQIGGGNQAQQQGGGIQGRLLQAALGMLTNKQTGGLGGLADMFRQAGLGEKVDSWIGTGQNLPVSGEEVQQALGPDQIIAIAQKIGIPPELASGALAKLLPQIIDHATPNGTVPDHSALEEGLTMLKGKLLSS